MPVMQIFNKVSNENTKVCNDNDHFTNWLVHNWCAGCARKELAKKGLNIFSGKKLWDTQKKS